MSMRPVTKVTPKDEQKHTINSDIGDPYREVNDNICTLRLFIIKYVDKHINNITKYIYYSLL